MLNPCVHLDWSSCRCENDRILHNYWNGLDQDVLILVPNDYFKILDGLNILSHPEEKRIWSYKEIIRCIGVWWVKRSIRTLSVIDCWS